MEKSLLYNPQVPARYGYGRFKHLELAAKFYVLSCYTASVLSHADLCTP